MQTRGTHRDSGAHRAVDGLERVETERGHAVVLANEDDTGAECAGSTNALQSRHETQCLELGLENHEVAHDVPAEQTQKLVRVANESVSMHRLEFGEGSESGGRQHIETAGGVHLHTAVTCAVGEGAGECSEKAHLRSLQRIAVFKSKQGKLARVADAIHRLAHCSTSTT